MAVDTRLQSALEGRVSLHPDAVVLDGGLWSIRGIRILDGFLRDHPRREAALRQAMPDGERAVVAHAVVREGRLWLERVSVPGTKDELLDMVLWHALFPGLKAPQVVYWMSGNAVLTMDPPGTIFDIDPDAVFADDHRPDRRIHLARGMVSEGHAPERSRKGVLPNDLYQWPLGLRLLMAPIVLVMVPVVGLWHGVIVREKGWPPAWWFILIIPLALVAFTVKWIAPVTFDRHIEHRFHALGAAFRQRQAVRELVDAALRGDPSPSSARS